MPEVFLRIIEFSIYGTLWIMMLLLADRIFGRRGGILWRYFTAGCIVLHLLVPVHVQWIQLMPSAGWQEKMAKEALMEEGAVEAITMRQGETGDILASEPNGKTVSMQGVTDHKKKAGRNFSQMLFSVRRQIESIVRQNQEMLDSLLIVLRRIWFIGMICYFFWIFLSYRTFCKQMARWELPVKEEEERIFRQTKKQYGVKRRIALKRSSEAVSPMLYGIVRPVVLLPDAEYCEKEYRYIFQHELCHYKHGDIWMKYLFIVCRGIYWFCPPIWRLCRYAFTQMEFLCDETVVRGKDKEEKREYSMVIFRHILQGRKWESAILTTHFYGGKECVKLRFEHIMGTATRKACIGAVAVAAACVAFLGGVKWGSAAETDHTAKTEQPVIEKKAVEKKILVIGSRDSDYAEALLLIHVDEEAGSVTLERLPEGQEIYFMDELKHMSGKNALEDGDKEPLLSAKYFVYGMLRGKIERDKRSDMDLSCVMDEKRTDRLMTVLEMLSNKTAKEFDRKEFIELLTEGMIELGVSKECRVGDLTALMEKVLSGELEVDFTGSWEEKMKVAGREYGYPTGVYIYEEVEK